MTGRAPIPRRERTAAAFWTVSSGLTVVTWMPFSIRMSRIHVMRSSRSWISSVQCFTSAQTGRVRSVKGSVQDLHTRRERRRRRVRHRRHRTPDDDRRAALAKPAVIHPGPGRRAWISPQVTAAAAGHPHSRGYPGASRSKPASLAGKGAGCRSGSRVPRGMVPAVSPAGSRIATVSPPGRGRSCGERTGSRTPMVARARRRRG